MADQAASSPEHPEHGAAVSVRTAEHRGHAILIRTRYEIEVDGQPFGAHINVDNAGRVQYHGLPTRDFGSLVDLVKRAIDAFPEDFPGGLPPQPPLDPAHQPGERDDAPHDQHHMRPAEDHAVAEPGVPISHAGDRVVADHGASSHPDTSDEPPSPARQPSGGGYSPGEAGETQ